MGQVARPTNQYYLKWQFHSTAKTFDKPVGFIIFEARDIG